MGKLARPQGLSTLSKARNQTDVSNTQQSSAKIDVSFIFDTTISMYGYLEEVRKQLSYLSDEIQGKIPKAKIGVIAYGDYWNAQTTYVTKKLDLTDDYQQVKSFINRVKKTDGGDFLEAVEEALYQANQLKWRLGSRRAIVLVGDAPPHGVTDSFQNCKYGHNYQDETKELARKGIKVYAVQCGQNKDAEKSFREMAQLTNGLYLRLDNIADLVDLLVSICMKEVGLLAEYESKLKGNHSLTPSKQKLLKQLSGGTDN